MTSVCVGSALMLGLTGVYWLQTWSSGFTWGKGKMEQSVGEKSVRISRKNVRPLPGDCIIWFAAKTLLDFFHDDFSGIIRMYSVRKVVETGRHQGIVKQLFFDAWKSHGKLCAFFIYAVLSKVFHWLERLFCSLSYQISWQVELILFICKKVI